MTLFETLTAAVRAFEQRGYDSEESLRHWVSQLRASMQESLVSVGAIEATARKDLRTIFTRLIERGEIVRGHPGVSRFTLDKVKPQLRAELDRRMLASANLIRLNRESAIEKTIQRFSGWATSIPAGGSRAVNKVDVKSDIRNSLTKLPFEERRVLIDQGHKFTASLNEILAVDGGALAAIWRSRYRQPGYNYRPDHRERDGRILLIRNSWAVQNGLIKVGPDGYIDDITRPGEEVFCRCSYQYVYNLRDLPDNMLTAKGRSALNRS